MLLYAPGPAGRINEPIKGRTRLQKEVFLLQKALVYRKIRRLYPFMPYHYGPFSRELYRDFGWLEYKKLAKERIIKNNADGVYRDFRLTSKGITETRNFKAKKEMSEIYEIVKEIKQKYNQMPLRSLVQYTHETWPEYVLS